MTARLIIGKRGKQMTNEAQPLVCGHTWTTGTGPDDPHDTGIHACAYPPLHGWAAHHCRCGERS